MNPGHPRARGSVLVLSCLAVVCVLSGRGSGFWQRPDPAPAAVQAPVQPAVSHREWAKDAKPAGSKSCEKCHPEHYQRWQDSAHSKMVRLPGPDSIAGDFTRDNTLRWKGYTYRMFIRDRAYFMEVTNPRQETTTYTIDYAVGSRRVQGYMSRLPDGRLYLLPVYWRITTQSWFDSSLITPATAEGVGVKQYWNTNCLACHATDLKFGFDPVTARFSTEWLELAIGCEACHNPGSKHNEFFEKKPLRDYVRRELNDTYISNQRYFDARRNTELCASCHGTKVNYFLGYWPGDRGDDYFTPVLMTFDTPDQQGESYADGRPTRFNHFQEFMTNRCFLEGKATCLSCHEGHSSPNESLLLVPKEQSNVLCLNCHQAKYGGTKLTAHTFHLPDSPGSRCYACHMGETLERLMMHRRDHSFDNPVPELSVRYGVPNACNSRGCHADRTAEWAARTLDQWYGGEKRRRLLYFADATWLAKQDDTRAIPLLIRAMADTNLRLTARASAAGLIGLSFGPRATAAVPGLVAALRSGEPLLQRAAMQALGRIGDRRGVGPVSVLLASSARTIRVTAAAALINMGAIHMEGDAGAQLEAAKAEYVAALRGWPNVPDLRVDLGSYHLVHGEYDQAIAEYTIALQIDAARPDAWYYMGRAYAMQKRVAEAVRAWKKALELKPDLPGVADLIAAAEALPKETKR